MDWGNNVYESNETNNSRSVLINIASPDLAAASLSILTNLTSQQLISPFYSVSNVAGVAALPGWSDRLYLSRNGLLDSNSIQIGVDFTITTNLPAGGLYTNLVNVCVPGVPAGDYFVLLDADGDHFFNEPNFANNLLAQPVHIVNPDLTPTYFNAPTSLAVTQLNQSFPVDWTVLNQGAGSAFVSLERLRVSFANQCAGHQCGADWLQRHVRRACPRAILQMDMAASPCRTSFRAISI